MSHLGRSCSRSPAVDAVSLGDRYTKLELDRRRGDKRLNRLHEISVVDLQELRSLGLRKVQLIDL